MKPYTINSPLTHLFIMSPSAAPCKAFLSQRNEAVPQDARFCVQSPGVGVPAMPLELLCGARTIAVFLRPSATLKDEHMTDTTAYEKLPLPTG